VSEAMVFNYILRHGPKTTDGTIEASSWKRAKAKATTLANQSSPVWSLTVWTDAGTASSTQTWQRSATSPWSRVV